MAVLVNNGLSLWPSPRRFAALAQPQGASRVAMSSRARQALAASPALAISVGPRLATGAHGLCPQFQVGGRLLGAGVAQAAASSAPVVVAPRIGASAVAAQVTRLLGSTLAPAKGCCLTLRSWGLPPAAGTWPAHRSVLIIRLAGQAPSRRQPLSSNVGPQTSGFAYPPSSVAWQWRWRVRLRCPPHSVHRPRGTPALACSLPLAAGFASGR